MAAPSVSGGLTVFQSSGDFRDQYNMPTGDVPPDAPFPDPINGEAAVSITRIRASNYEGFTVPDIDRTATGGFTSAKLYVANGLSYPLDFSGVDLVFAGITGTDDTSGSRLETVDNHGIWIAAEDGAGNWAAWTIGGRDAVIDDNLIVDRLSTCIVDFSALDLAFDRTVGDLDPSDIVGIWHGAHTGGGSVTSAGLVWPGQLAPFVATGGEVSDPVFFGSFSDAAKAQNTHPNFFIRIGGEDGAQYAATCVVKIGDGSTQTYFEHTDFSVFFRSSTTDGVGLDQFRKFREGVLGVVVDQGASDDFILRRGRIEAVTTPFRFTFTSDAAASAVLDQVSVTKASPVSLSSVMSVTSCVFTSCGQIGVNGATISGTIVQSSEDSTGAALFDGSGSIDGMTFSGNDVDLRISASAPSSITLTDVTFTASPGDVNIIDLRTGTVTINIAGTGNTPTFRNDGGGATTVVAGSNLTITGIIAGGALAIWDDEDADPQDLGTLLASEEPIVDGTFVYTHSKAGDQIVIQHIASGFKEINRTFTLTASDQSIELEPQVEDNI